MSAPLPAHKTKIVAIIWPGSPSPLGATLTDSGVNFALFSEHATKVELCLFEAPDATVESQRIALPEKIRLL